MDDDFLDPRYPAPIDFDLAVLTDIERSAWFGMVAHYGLDHMYGDFEGIVYWVRFLRTRGYGVKMIRSAIMGSTRNSQILESRGPGIKEQMVTLTEAMVNQALEATEGETYHPDWIKAINDE